MVSPPLSSARGLPPGAGAAPHRRCRSNCRGVRERAVPVPPRGRLCLLLRGHHRSAGGGKRAGHPLHRRSPRSGFPLRQAGNEPGRHVVHPRVRHLADGVAGKRAGHLYRESEHRKSRRVRDDLHGSATGGYSQRGAAGAVPAGTRASDHRPGKSPFLVPGRPLSLLLHRGNGAG